MTSLSDVLDEDLLLEWAGDRYFDRGVRYHEQGRVSSLAQYGEQITAQVQGTESYQVNLWLENGELRFRCTCPVGMDGLFCKHCVATALAWIEKPPPYQASEAAPTRQGTALEDVEHYLAQQDREYLVRMIMERLLEDAQWRDQLVLRVAARRQEGVDIPTIRRMMQNAIVTGGYVDYDEAYEYFEGIQHVLHSLEELLDEGYSTEVMELTEEAAALLEGAIEQIDDSAGYMTLIIDKVSDLHLQACTLARPNPRLLAQRLFQLELNDHYGIFSNTVDIYADILGEEGLQTFNDQVDVEWAQLPDLGSGDRYALNNRHYTLSRMKEALVQRTGNVDEIVQVIAKDLSHPNRYLRIAELYREHGQPDQALTWAERGIDAFPDYRPVGLQDFLIAEYEQRGRLEDAVELIWKDFARSPSLPAYQKLKAQAEKNDTWPQRRVQALHEIRTRSQAPNRPRPATAFYGIGYSLLVEIFLWEGEDEMAWEAAQEGNCHPQLWMKLADRRAKTHPEDALSIYIPAIEPLINQTNNESYAQAVALLQKVQPLMETLNRTDKFRDLLHHLKVTYKRKRNFIKLLQDKRLI